MLKTCLGRVLVVLAGLTMAASGAAPLSAQSPRSLLSIEPDFIGGAVSYARRMESGRYWGLEAGVGGPLWNRMLLAGRHFADEGGPSYEPRDGARDKELLEILHLAVFMRKTTDRWDWDTGVRGSVFIHYDTSDDDPGIPSFLGGYTGILFGNRRIKVGPEIMVGWFSEGSNANELGVFLAPLTGRITFGW